MTPIAAGARQMTLRSAEVIRRTVRAVGIFMAMLVVFVAMMTAVFALPQETIIVNAGDSLPRLRSETFYHAPVLDEGPYKLDNYTDALMIDTAIADPGDGPFVAAIAARNGGSSAQGGPIEALAASAAGRRIPGGGYAYYWHGYQVVLRPALVFFEYEDIRYLNVMLLGALLLGGTLYVRHCAGTLIASTFAISLLAVGIYVVPLSLQFSGVVYLTIAAVIAVVALQARGTLRAWEIELFLVVGMVTAFVDLRTAPLLTLGLPLAVLLAVRARIAEPDAGTVRSLWTCMRLSAVWGAGYGGAWAAKWLIAAPVLGVGVARRALDQILFRTGTGPGGNRIAMALRQPLFDLIPLVRYETLSAAGGGIKVALFGVVTAIMVAVGVWLLAVARRSRADVVRASSVLLVVPLPYLWFLVANNHTAIHHFFAYRIQAAVVFALTFFFASCIDLERVRLQLRSRRKTPNEGEQ
jgi:hypothetical protein